MTWSLTNSPKIIALLLNSEAGLKTFEQIPAEAIMRHDQSGLIHQAPFKCPVSAPKLPASSCSPGGNMLDCAGNLHILCAVLVPSGAPTKHYSKGQSHPILNFLFSFSFCIFCTKVSLKASELTFLWPEPLRPSPLPPSASPATDSV